MIVLSHTPVLETDRLTLRAPTGSDWPHWRDFMASDRSHFVRQHEPDDAKAWRGFGHAIGHWVMRGWGSFVFCQRGSDRPLGMAGPWYPAGWPEREIGWTVWSTEAEGKGYAYEAAAAARNHAFDNLGWDSAVSYIAPENARSIALAERLGATRDEGAATPDFGEPCLVFRHSPSVLAKETPHV